MNTSFFSDKNFFGLAEMGTLGQNHKHLLNAVPDHDIKKSSNESMEVKSNETNLSSSNSIEKTNSCFYSGVESLSGNSITNEPNVASSVIVSPQDNDESCDVGNRCKTESGEKSCKSFDDLTTDIKTNDSPASNLNYTPASNLKYTLSAVLKMKLVNALREVNDHLFFSLLSVLTAKKFLFMPR